MLWLNPQDPETFPPDLLETLTSDHGGAKSIAVAQGSSAQENDRLRQQMRADALLPLSQIDDDSDMPLVKSKDRFPPQVVEEALVFIRLNVCALSITFFC